MELKLGTIKYKGTSPDCIKGLILNRPIQIPEARHILQNILNITIYTKDECATLEELHDWDIEYVSAVNNWLNGDDDNSNIREFAWECMNEPIGVFKILSVLMYLKEQNIID